MFMIIKINKILRIAIVSFLLRKNTLWMVKWFYFLFELYVCVCNW